MKSCKLLLSLLSICSFNFLNAYVEVEVDGRSAPEVTFSNKAFNRVSYKEGAVKSVVGSKNELDVNLSSGIAFIKPKPGAVGPITVTLITSDDEAQDLNILIGDKQAEHVRLLDPKEEVDQLLDKITAVNFLSAIVEGNCPQSYRENFSHDHEGFDLAEPLEGNFIQSYVGSGETVFVYRITNNSRKKDFVLSSALFKSSKHLWVFLTNPKLGPKESSLCLVSIPSKEVFE